MKLKILTLTILVSVLFCNIFAFGLCPWDTTFTLHCQGKSATYSLAKEAQNLSNEEKEMRKIYHADKWQVAQEFLQIGLPPRAVLNYIFYGISPILDDFEQKITKNKVDATFKFCPDEKEKFLYFNGVDGVEIDWYALLKQVCQKNKKIQIPLKIDRAKSIKQLKDQTALKGQFTTYFNQEKVSRSHNVALALQYINGTILHQGETFSFNQKVGQRTQERGFKSAKIIVGGRYVDGLGGGVCQASTTLYNAVLLANLKVEEVHAHTLVPSYVLAGRDAMVSFGAFDLKFVNDTNGDLYFVAFGQNGKATVQIYGIKNDFEVEIQTEQERTPFEKKYALWTKDKKFSDLYVAGSDGVKSKTFLVVKRGQNEEKRQIRADTYQKVDCIYPIDVVLP